jgi:hypothetical protein
VDVAGAVEWHRTFAGLRSVVRAACEATRRVIARAARVSVNLRCALSSLGKRKRKIPRAEGEDASFGKRWRV